MEAKPMAWLLLAIGCIGGWPLAAQAAEIRVAFATTLEPFVFARTHGGIEVEIVRSVLQRLGHTLEPVYVPNARVSHLFERRQVDAAATSLQEQGASGFFSEPYIVFQNIAVTLAERKLRLDSIADMAGLKVVAFQKAGSYLGDEFHRMAQRNPKYREIADHLGQARLLYRGGADVIVIERHVFDYQNKILGVARYPESVRQVHIHPLFPPTPYRMRFHDKALRDAFDLELATVTRLGIPEAIARKYGY